MSCGRVPHGNNRLFKDIEMTLSATWRGHVDVWRNNGIAPPWVPTFEDVTLMQNAFNEGVPSGRKARVLILGVTPAIVMARWLEDCEMKAADYDRDMIEALWPADAGHRAEAVCADWSALPFADDHFDLVVGDGSFCALPDMTHYPSVLAEILRVKRKAAPIITRFFVRPDALPTFHDIVSADGTLLLPDHDPTELRFLTILAACDPDGLLDHKAIAGKITSQWGNLDKYIAGMCPDEQSATAFRLTLERKSCLNFPTFRQIDEQVAQFGLRATAYVPSYRVGVCCPTIRFDG